MHDTIKFVPLIELPTEKDAESLAYLTAAIEKDSAARDAFQAREIQKNYATAIKPIASGIYQYPLFSLGLEATERLIALHVADGAIQDSCSFFGGYGLLVNEKMVLYPQCCGLLEDIQDWKNLFKTDVQDFYLSNGHPAPLISRREDQLIIYCSGSEEQFIPQGTAEQLVLDYHQSKLALEKVIKELTDFGQQLDLLSAKFKVKHLADILIWGNL